MLKVIKRVVKHSLTMMRIHWQSYLTLSITICISLGLFLGILLYSDTNYFNENKISSSTPSNAIQYSNLGESFINLINAYSQTFEQTYVIQWQTSNTNIPPFHIQKYSFSANLHFVDRNFFFYPNHQDEFVPITLVEGRLFSQQEISNHDHVVLIEEKFADIFFEDGKALNQELLLPTVFTNEKSPTIQPFKIIGITRTLQPYPKNIFDMEGATIAGNVYLPISLRKQFIDLETTNHQLIVSNSEEAINSISRNMSLLGVQSVSTTSQRARAINAYVAMRQNQIPVLSVLLFILSLNLFSLHNNVLKNRRQEIAIKRALGFSKKEIVMEFLLEGTIIFLINLLIISFIIFSIGVLWHYKNYQLIRGVYPVSIMIYPFSIKIFLVSSIFLTILNSVVLAFLATRINIIDAIKTE